MKLLINLIAMLLLASCGSDSEKQYAVNFALENETKLSEEDFKKELSKYENFNSAPVEGDLISMTTEEIYSIEAAGSIQRRDLTQDCSYLTLEDISHEVRSTEDGALKILESRKIIASQLEKGKESQCKDTDEIGSEDAKYYTIETQATHAETFLALLKEQLNSVTKDDSSQVFLSNFSKGTYEGKEIYKLNLEVDGTSNDSEDGISNNTKVRIDCSILINPEHPFHLSYEKIQCLGTSQSKLKDSMGSASGSTEIKVDYKLKERIYANPVAEEIE